MAGFQNFRTALNGFKRADVVNYIEYMNNRHNSQLEQLNSQLQTANAKIAQLGSEDNTALRAQLDTANARIAELEAQLAALRSGECTGSEQELETYRRAERTERIARERASQIYAQANAVLAEATLKVDNASAQIGTAADQIAAQLQEYHTSVSNTKAMLQDVVAAMYAIRPEAE